MVRPASAIISAAAPGVSPRTPARCARQSPCPAWSSCGGGTLSGARSASLACGGRDLTTSTCSSRGSMRSRTPSEGDASMRVTAGSVGSGSEPSARPRASSAAIDGCCSSHAASAGHTTRCAGEYPNLSISAAARSSAAMSTRGGGPSRATMSVVQSRRAAATTASRSASASCRSTRTTSRRRPPPDGTAARARSSGSGWSSDCRSQRMIARGPSCRHAWRTAARPSTANRLRSQSSTAQTVPSGGQSMPSMPMERCCARDDAASSSAARRTASRTRSIARPIP